MESFDYNKQKNESVFCRIFEKLRKIACPK